MKMDAGLDTGPMLALHRLIISEEDDAQMLHDRLAKLGAEAIVKALDDIVAGRVRQEQQPDTGATYAHKIRKEETDLDWTKPAEELERKIRALRPVPGARSLLRGETVKIWRASCVSRKGAPGEVLEQGVNGILVACGDGALRVTELQRAGGTRLAAADFLHGFSVSNGDRFGAAR
jgi:methionyl-tRNA formyltransferase